MKIFNTKDVIKIFSARKLSMNCASIFLLLIAAICCAEDSQLHIKPSRCIALHQGQLCYQTLKVNWRADTVDTYCLYQAENKNALVCWENKSNGNGEFEFESSSTQKFMLLRKGDVKPVAEVIVEVAWVYDASSHRESHWRVF